MKENTNMLSVNEVSKSYPGKENALKEVSFQVDAGEICGLVGNNGAGKSSIIRCIVGAQEADAGEIFINGKSLKKESVLCKAELGYIPDNQAVYHYLTGRQYLDLISSFYDISKAAKEERIANLVYMLQMEDVIHKPVSAYSRGMKQKLLIMAAIIHEPNLIVMDEPFTGLDPSTVEQLIKVINAERERGAGILFSSHMLDIVTRISDKVVVIKNGNIEHPFIKAEQKCEDERTLSLVLYFWNYGTVWGHITDPNKKNADNREFFILCIWTFSCCGNIRLRD